MFITNIFALEQDSYQGLPLMMARIPAGFPSPAEDYVDRKLDLNSLLIRHPAATFFVRAEGDSMIGAGIHSGDLLIVDRALEAKNGDVVIAFLNGELIVKRIRRAKGRLSLIPDNPEYSPIEVTPEMDFDIRGVVTYVIHKVR